MSAFVVPGTVFAPVGGRDFFKRVVECVLGRENFHRRLATKSLELLQVVDVRKSGLC